MRWTTILAIYFLFWFLSLFLVLPFGVKTAEEAGQKVGRGHADSAPHQVRPLRIILRTSLLAALFLTLFYLNYVNGWVTIDSFDFLYSPPADAAR